MADIIQSEIGSHPADWSIQRVDSLFDIQQGKSVSKVHREGDNQKSFLRTKNVFWGKIDISELDQMHFTEQEETRLKLRAGDLLLCEGGDVGRASIWNYQMEGCYYQNHLHRLRAKTANEVDPQFALYWFWYAFEIANLYIGRSNVTTIPNLSQSKLSELQIPKPEFSEQRRIAHVLTTVQTAIEQQARLIALTRELKSALMKKLFTEGLRGENQKETEIGLVPESWDVVKIGDVFKFSSGKIRPSYIEENPTSDKPFPVYGGNGVMGYADIYLLGEPTLILGRVGEYCGVAHHTIGKAWISDNALYTKEIKREANTKYMAEYFTFANLNQYSNKAGQPLITQGIISAISIPLPKLDEQEEMYQYFDVLNNKSELLQSKKEKLEELFRTLLHQLMTGEVRTADLRGFMDFADRGANG